MLKKLYLRDVGGNIANDGRRVRCGLLYRSSDLHRLTASDGDHLDRLGLRQIIDLREPHIVARRPDRFLEAYLNTIGFRRLEELRARFLEQD